MEEETVVGPGSVVVEDELNNIIGGLNGGTKVMYYGPLRPF